MDEDLAALKDELRALAARVEILEDEQRHSPSHPLDDGDTFWALNGLQDRLDDDATTADGAVMLVGSLTLPDGSPVSWQQVIGTAGLVEADWAERASVFAALGHPVRVELLRHILSGAHATAELAAIDSLGTTGQLHHHLRQLVAAGWVRQSGRGSYQIPPARVVPLLVFMMGAER